MIATLVELGKTVMHEHAEKRHRSIIGANEKAAQEAIDDIIRLETLLANVSPKFHLSFCFWAWSLQITTRTEDTRNMEKQYNPMTIAEVKATLPEVFTRSTIVCAKKYF